MTVLVLGGYGAVGQHLIGELRGAGTTALAAGRDPDRADVRVDLAEAELGSLRRAAAAAEVVVNASGSEDPRVATAVAAAGAAFVDISATSDYLAELERLTPAAPVLIGVGLAPGLTNLLAAAVHAAAPGPVDIGVMLGAGEKHGAAATAWSYGLLGRTFRDGAGTVRNYTAPLTFDLPGHGRRRMYRTDFADQHALTRDLGVPVRTYFALDSRLATAALSTATWIPGARHMPRTVPMPGTDEWIALARGGSGELRWARGWNQSAATAALTAVAVRAVTALGVGVHQQHSVQTVHDVTGLPGIEFGSCSAEVA
ncbi:hypothetical protein [Nocardia sp. NPDC057353]|uniref:hypothetical protein n=1 Tax=Nocardia sp. NPDC057353 TaxID=3346104 RepID=UPI0036289715